MPITTCTQVYTATWGIESITCTQKQVHKKSLYVLVLDIQLIKAELKITAGPRPFSVQFSTMATQNVIMIASNCTDGPIKISVWPTKPEVLFNLQLC